MLFFVASLHMKGSIFGGCEIMTLWAVLSITKYCFVTGLITLPAEITKDAKKNEIVSSINKFLKRKSWLILLELVCYVYVARLLSNVWLKKLGRAFNLGVSFKFWSKTKLRL